MWTVAVSVTDGKEWVIRSGNHNPTGSLQFRCWASCGGSICNYFIHILFFSVCGWCRMWKGVTARPGSPCPAPGAPPPTHPFTRTHPSPQGQQPLPQHQLAEQQTWLNFCPYWGFIPPPCNRREVFASLEIPVLWDSAWPPTSLWRGALWARKSGRSPAKCPTILRFVSTSENRWWKDNWFCSWRWAEERSRKRRRPLMSFTARSTARLLLRT